MEDASYTWGFKVRHESDLERAKKEKLDLEIDTTAVIRNVNLDLKSGDFLVVVGKIGTGKTTLLMSIMEET